MVTFLWFVVCVLIYPAVLGIRQMLDELAMRKAKQPTAPFDFRKLFFPTKPEQPRDYAQTSIPRTRGPWRRQMRDLQAEHNTKQKERDALFAPQSQQENPNVRKAR